MPLFFFRRRIVDGIQKVMGYKPTSLFQECSSNIQDKLIFITTRNISSRFFNFEIKNRRRSIMVFTRVLLERISAPLRELNRL